MDTPKICECCGAKMVEYKHGLSKGLIRGLWKAAKAAGLNGEFDISKCNLTYSQRENLRKLQYWGLIRKLGDDDNKGGQWEITKKGWDFLSDRLTVTKSVWTYRGSVVRNEGEYVSVMDVTGGWKYRPDYAEEAVPHGC